MGTSDAQKAAGKVFERRRKPINGWSKADKNRPHEFTTGAGHGRLNEHVLKPGGSAFVFSGRRFSHRCISALEDDGFNLRDILSWKRKRLHSRLKVSLKLSETRLHRRSQNGKGGE